MTAPMTETEQEDIATLCENWETLAPLVAEVSRRTGCSRVEALLLVLFSTDDETPEPWEA